MNEIERLLSLLFDGKPTKGEEQAARARLEAHIAEQGAADTDRSMPDGLASADNPPRPDSDLRARSRLGLRPGWAGVAVTSALVMVTAILLARVLLPGPVAGLVELAEATRLLPDEEFGEATLIRERDETVLVVEPAAEVNRPGRVGDSGAWKRGWSYGLSG
ncbi:MAG: hypothetical protein P1T08_18425 [Acidimicrobiia bacterium]|nr:hypothetical protein [Acidimicrobiia bacterium]